MILQEIHQEALKRTKSKIRNHVNRMFSTAFLVTILLTMCFYYFGVGDFQWSIAKTNPLFVTVLVGTQTFFGMINLQFLIFYSWSVGESTRSKVKNGLEQRHENRIKENAEAIRDRFNQFGQRDYSIQIDEAKEGLRYEISDWAKFTSEWARRFSIAIFSTKSEILKLRREVQNLRAEVESLKQKQSENVQEMGQNFHAKDTHENTKIDDKTKKFESRD